MRLEAFIAKQSRQFGGTLRKLIGSPKKQERWAKLDAATRSTLESWTKRELAYWTEKRISKQDLHQAFETKNLQCPSIFIIDIENSHAKLRPKHNGSSVERPAFYICLVQKALDQCRFPVSTTIAIDIADLPESTLNCPVFSFQKKKGAPNILLPDPDFYYFDWYPYSFAQRAYCEKIDGAIFAGSSTGCLTITQDIIENLVSERLWLASRLDGHPDILFKITRAVECDTPETEALLRSQPYFSETMIGWEEQLKRKFIISVDGNGPTCSRVLQTLLSTSVLLKSRSDHILYYYHGLNAFEHYLPFSEIGEIELLVNLEKAGCLNTKKIIKNANRFARAHLSPGAVITYTQMLIERYSETYGSHS